MFFSFSSLNMSCQTFLACQVSVDKSDVILMDLPLYIRSLFPLAALKSSYLQLWFIISTIRCLEVFLDSMILGEDLSAFRTLTPVPFARLGKFSWRICSTISSSLLSFSFPSIILTLEHFMVSFISLILCSWLLCCLFQASS